MPSELIDKLRLELRRGSLTIAVLAQLRSEHYGYTLRKALAELGLEIDEGTLYPLLSRLRVQGLVTARLEESSEGPARKYYALSPVGRETLELMQQYMDSLNQGARILRKRGATA